jgi:hypothetical protein
VDAKTPYVGLFALLTALLPAGYSAPGKNLPVFEVTALIDAVPVNRRTLRSIVYFMPNQMVVQFNAR